MHYLYSQYRKGPLYFAFRIRVYNNSTGGVLCRVLLLTEIGFFKCQVQNLRAIEEGGLWYVKSVRLDISVGRNQAALCRRQAACVQSCTVLGCPKLPKYSAAQLSPVSPQRPSKIPSRRSELESFKLISKPS